VHNATLVVLNYASVDLVGSDFTLTVDVRRPHCTRQRTCLFTNDRQLVNRSDAIVFSDMQQSHHFPSHRPPHQKWVLRTMEVGLQWFSQCRKFAWNSGDEGADAKGLAVRMGRICEGYPRH